MSAEQARVLRAAADLLDDIEESSPLPQLYITVGASGISIQVPADARQAADRLAVLDRIAAPIGTTEDTRHVDEHPDGGAHYVADGEWQGIPVDAYAPVRAHERGAS